MTNKLTPEEMIDKINDENQLTPQDDEVAEVEKTKKVTPPRKDSNDGRSPMNHASDAEVENIGGIQFRRSRESLDQTSKKALDIDSKYLNIDLEYRWVNDSSGRVEKVRQLGYEMIDSLADGKISVRRRVGVHKDGTDQYAVLMATPKKWLKDRRKKSEEVRKAHEEGLFRSPHDENGIPLGSEFYNKGSSLK